MPKMNFLNFWVAELASGITDSDLSYPLDDIQGATSPVRIVIDPEDDLKREVVEADGTFSGNTMSSTDIAKRGLQGSASGAQAHNAGTKVWMAWLSQDADDLWSDKADVTGDTFTGPVVLSDQLLTRADLKDYSEAVNALGTVTTSLSVDYTAGQVVTATLGGDATVSVTDPPATAGSLTLILTQDGTGGRTVTWPASFKWGGGVEPTLSTDPGAVDVITAFTPDGGTTFYAHAAGRDYS